jgi:hypothetical protein
MVVVEAKVVDSTHLELSQPIQTASGDTVVVSVMKPGEEREDWLSLSGRRLAEAYGNDEPDYSPDMIKEPKADHKS